MDQTYNFIIARNAETDLDIVRPKVLSGQLERSLNNYGKLQALALAERISHISFSEIYTSDQRQALETAEEILTLQTNARLIHDQRLRECHTGNMTGMSFKELDQLSQESNISFDEFLDRVGESSQDFQERVQEFYNQVIVGSIIENDKEEHSSLKEPSIRNILIISHSGWIDAFMHFLIDDLNFEVLQLQNRFPYKASIYEFKVFKTYLPGEEKDQWRGIVPRMNDASHLAILTKMTQNESDRAGLLNVETPIGTSFTSRREIMVMLGMHYCSFITDNHQKDSTPLGKSPNDDVVMVDDCSQDLLLEELNVRKRSLGW